MIYIDLSHTIKSGEITYKGLPAPLVCDFLSHESSKEYYDEGTSFCINKIELVGNSGTYLDTPFHRFKDGKCLNDYPVDRFVDLEYVVVDADYESVGRAVDLNVLEGLDIKQKAVLFKTNWSKHWGTDTYFEHTPYLTAAVADYLVEQEVLLAGIDSYNIDNTEDKSRPVHTKLLGNDIFIVEHMTGLNLVPEHNPGNFSALPLRIDEVGTFPVRAFIRY